MANDESSLSSFIYIIFPFNARPLCRNVKDECGTLTLLGMDQLDGSTKAVA